MKLQGLTINQWASKANAVAVWRKRLAKNLKPLNGLASLLTFQKGILTPPAKDKTKTLVLEYIGGATDEKTLLKHVRRIAKVLGVGDLETTYATDPTYTLQIKRLQLRVKLTGIKVAAPVQLANVPPVPTAPPVAPPEIVEAA